LQRFCSRSYAGNNSSELFQGSSTVISGTKRKLSQVIASQMAGPSVVSFFQRQTFGFT
jgi:hypothetical protein